MDNDYWHTYAANIYRYNPDEAKKLLSDAGYANGFTLKFWVSPQSALPDMDELAQIIQGYWKKIGINAPITPIDWGAFKAYRNCTKSTVAIGSVWMDTTNARPIAPMGLFQGFETTGAYALIGTKNNVDAQIDGAMTEKDPAKRKEMIAQAVKFTTDAYVTLVVGWIPSLAAIGPSVDITFNDPTTATPVYAYRAKHTGK
jgi:ABC-type transport system substrate-binding protein